MPARKPAPKARMSQSLTSQPSASQNESGAAKSSQSTPTKRGRKPGVKRVHKVSKYEGPLENSKHGKFAIYIARVVKDINRGAAADASGKGTEQVPLKLGRRSMAIVNAFAEDMADRLQTTALEIANRSGKKTVGLAECSLATRWLLGDIGNGELEKFALSEGSKAILNYTASIKPAAQ